MAIEELIVRTADADGVRAAFVWWFAPAVCAGLLALGIAFMALSRFWKWVAERFGPQIGLLGRGYARLSQISAVAFAVLCVPFAGILGMAISSAYAHVSPSGFDNRDGLPPFVVEKADFEFAQVTRILYTRHGPRSRSSQDHVEV